MKLTVDRGALLAALTPVVRIVSRKPSIPVLSHILLRADVGQEMVLITGTDTDREVETAATAEVMRQGETTVPAHLLFDFLRKAEAPTLSMETSDDGGRMKVTAGKARVALNALPPADFPVMQTTKRSWEFEVPARDLRTPFARVAYAQSNEETRYFLCGVHLHPTDDSLAFVATDGHRLARTTIPLPAGAERMPAIIVPSETVAELQKLLDIDGDAVVELDDRSIAVMAGPVKITSKLVDGTYPDYRRVIPTAHDRTLKLCPKALLSAVERVATITSERGSRVNFSISDEGVGLAMRSPDAGDSSDHLEAVAYDGEPIVIGFNSKYVTGVLGAVTGDEIEVRMTEPGSPVVIHDPTEAQTLRLMMPMAVQ